MNKFIKREFLRIILKDLFYVFVCVIILWFCDFITPYIPFGKFTIPAAIFTLAIYLEYVYVRKLSAARKVDESDTANYQSSRSGEVNTWEDLAEINGAWIDNESIIRFCENRKLKDYHRNVFNDEKQAKSALAMAQLSQIIPHYCRPISDNEWKDPTMEKIVISRIGDSTLYVERRQHSYNFLAFRTEEQAERFLQKNRKLIEQYYMMADYEDN